MARYDELTGSAAFELVLEKLTEESRSRAEDIKARHDAEAKTRDAERLLQAERGTRAQLEGALKKYTDAEDAFARLYDAIETAEKLLTPEDSLPLRTAAAAAKKFIDPIPF